MNKRVGAIILAGGSSVRMGENKAALILDGQTLLQRTVDTIRQIISDVVVIYSHPGAEPVVNCPSIYDKYPGEGPLGGILTGFKYPGEGMRFVLACDMPLLSSKLLELLIVHYDETSDAVVPVKGEYLEGLCALYSVKSLPKVQSYFNAGGRSIKGALKQLNIQLLEEEKWRAVIDMEEVLSSANTPAEFERLRTVFYEKKHKNMQR